MIGQVYQLSSMKKLPTFQTTSGVYSMLKNVRFWWVIHVSCADNNQNEGLLVMYCLYIYIQYLHM